MVRAYSSECGKQLSYCTHFEEYDAMNKLTATVDQYKAVISLAAALLVLFFGERGGMTADQIAQAVWVLVAYIIKAGLEARR